MDTEPENLRVFEALQQADLDKVESPLGKKHRASEWLEDGGETEYYLDTDGSFYNYEHGVPVHVAQLSQEDVERLSGKYKGRVALSTYRDTEKISSRQLGE